MQRWNRQPRRNYRPWNQPPRRRVRNEVERAQSSVDVSEWEENLQTRSETDFFDMPFGCRWEEGDGSSPTDVAVQPQAQEVAGGSRFGTHQQPNPQAHEVAGGSRPQLGTQQQPNPLQTCRPRLSSLGVLHQPTDLNGPPPAVPSLASGTSRPRLSSLRAVHQPTDLKGPPPAAPSLASGSSRPRLSSLGVPHQPPTDRKGPPPAVRSLASGSTGPRFCSLGFSQPQPRAQDVACGTTSSTLRAVHQPRTPKPLQPSVVLNGSPVRADQDSQTDEEPETELFQTIVFDIDLLEAVGDRMPKILDTICKIVISPTAVLEGAIIDPQTAQCDAYPDRQRSTQTANDPGRWLVSRLLSDPQIDQSIGAKDALLSARLRKIYQM